jgi:hypothetical protein
MPKAGKESWFQSWEGKLNSKAGKERLISKAGKESWIQKLGRKVELKATDNNFKRWRLTTTSFKICTYYMQ